jgi:hypothetical protein
MRRRFGTLPHARIGCAAVATCLLASGAVRGEGTPSSCVLEPSSATVEPTLQDPGHQPDPPKLDPADLRPATDGDVRNLILVLGALKSEKTAASTLKDLAAGRPFTNGRFSVLLGDAKAVFLGAHADDLRPAASKMPPDMKKWFEGSLDLMEGCGPRRFDARGGPSAYDRYKVLVLKNRVQLEPLILNAMPRSVGVTTGGIPVKAPPR